MKDRVLVSVVIPTFNEETYIEKCVRSFLENKCDFSFEILVVDGGSEDRTIEIVSGLDSGKIRVLNNEKKYTPYALNMGVRNAKGDYIVFFGAHSFPEKDFLQKSYDAMLRTDADCVGGRSVPIADTSWGEDISIVLSSPFGIGNAKYRYQENESYVDTVAAGCYRREVFDRVGLFDENLIRNQDDEFNQRMIERGGKIFYTPSRRHYYYVRGSLKKLFKQYYQYGFWKVAVQKKRKGVVSYRHLVPMLFVFFIVAGGMISWLFPQLRVWYGGVWLIYLAMSLFFSLRYASHLSRMFRLPLLFLTVHLAYGLGYWRGIIKVVFGL